MRPSGIAIALSKDKSTLDQNPRVSRVVQLVFTRTATKSQGRQKSVSCTTTQTQGGRTVWTLQWSESPAAWYTGWQETHSKLAPKSSSLWSVFLLWASLFSLETQWENQHACQIISSLFKALKHDRKTHPQNYLLGISHHLQHWSYGEVNKFWVLFKHSNKTGQMLT